MEDTIELKSVVFNARILYNPDTENIIIISEKPPYHTAFLARQAHPALYDMLLETIKANKTDD